MASEDLIAELKELREMVNQSSEHTQRQLQNIDSNLLIGSLISFILALGIGFQLKILAYWIPASFLLVLCLWIFYMLPSAIGTFTQENVEGLIKAFQKIGKNKLEFAFTWAFKIASTILMGVSIVCIGTLIALGLIVNKTIAVNQPFNTLIPFISALLGVPLPFFLDFFKKSSESGGINESFNRLSKIRESVKPTIWRIIVGVIRLIYLAIILLVVVLLIWALVITYSIISDYLVLISVVILQLIVIIIFISYFSSLSVKKELTNALTKFAILDYLINDLILSKDINEDKVEKIKASYLTAKQYNVSVYDGLKFINIYHLSMNDTFLNKK